MPVHEPTNILQTSEKLNKNMGPSTTYIHTYLFWPSHISFLPLCRMLDFLLLFTLGWPNFGKFYQVNFIHKKFLQKTTNSYSLRKRIAEKCENHQNPTTFKVSY